MKGTMMKNPTMKGRTVDPNTDPTMNPTMNPKETGDGDGRMPITLPPRLTVTHRCGHQLQYPGATSPSRICRLERARCRTCQQTYIDRMHEAQKAGREPDTGAKGGSAPPIPHEIPTPPQIAAIPTSAIAPSPLNPRRRFDEAGLAALATSIQQHGVLEPLIVRKQAGVATPFSLLAGERRWRAAILAGLAEVPCVIRDAPDDATALALMLVENLQREDLDPIAQAEAFSRLADLGWTQSAIGEKVGKSQPVIANAIRLLGLPVDVRELIGDGKLSAAHGRALARWNTDPERCRSLARQAMDHDLTSRDLEKMRDDLEELRTRHAITGPEDPAAERAELEEAEKDAQSALADLTGHSADPEQRTCRVCGCTDDHGCEEGCWWVDTDLCSSCLAHSAARDRSIDDTPATPENREARGETHDPSTRRLERQEWEMTCDRKRARLRDAVRDPDQGPRIAAFVSTIALQFVSIPDEIKYAREALNADRQADQTGHSSGHALPEQACILARRLTWEQTLKLAALAVAFQELGHGEKSPNSQTPLTDWLLGEDTQE